MMKLKIPNLEEIIEPSWSHKPGQGVNEKGWFKQKIWEQATTPEDPNLLQKLGIKKREKVLAIAGFYANWASAIKRAGAKVDYSDVSHSIVNYVKKNVKTKFGKYICSNYELLPKKPQEYDWTFTFEACGGGQGLPIAYLRSLINNKGGILVLYYEKGGHMGSKYKRYPRIVNTLSKIYKTKSFVKKVNFRGYRKGKETKPKLLHIIYTVETNKNAREKVELDIKSLEYLMHKKVVNLEEDSKKFNIPKKDLKGSLERLSKITNLIKNEFVKEIIVK